MSQVTDRVRYAFLIFVLITAISGILYIALKRNSQAASSSTVEGRSWSPPPADVKALRLGDVPSSINDSDEDVQLQMVSKECGWLSTGKILWKTQDEGKHWKLVYQDPRLEIRQFKFINSQVGWVMTSTRLYKTLDGGLNWIKLAQPINSESEGELSACTFLEDGRRGWISGGLYTAVSNDDYIPSRYLSVDEQHALRGVIFYTEDGGQNWNRQLLTPHWGHLTVLFAKDAEHIWAAGTAGGFYYSQGKWNPMSGGPTELSNSTRVESLAVRIGYPTIEPAYLFFLNSSLGWLSNSNGYLAMSSDGGKTWQDKYQIAKINDNSPDNFIKLFFTDPLNGWACGFEGSLYRTNDGGISWEKVVPEIHFYDIDFLESGDRWAVSEQGLFHIN